LIEYITAKQFLEQPEEVRNVLLHWWQLGERELVQGCYYGEFYDSEHIWNIGYIDMDYCKNELKPIPLFIEGQLRHFIEDKIGGKIDTTYWENGYEINVFKRCESTVLLYFTYTDQTDLLQAYWQVACKIAKEG
jgi:hypothetical protein